MTSHSWSRSWAYSLLAIGMLAACGSSSSSNKSPTEKCFDLVDELCKRIVQCTPGAAGMQAACEQQAEADATEECQMVTSVKPSYDTCMAQLDQVACDSLFQTMNGQQTTVLPDPCIKVLTQVGPATPTAVMRKPFPVDFSRLTSVAEEPR